MTHQGQSGITFHSSGSTLLGTIFLARGDDPKPTALILHGLPGIEKNVDLAIALRENGWNSVVFHYRGCWGSGGDYSIRTLPDDVQAAIDFLSAGGSPQVDVSKLALIGHSMGGWAAILAAARDQRVKAVVVYGAVADPRQFQWPLSLVEVEFIPWLHGVTSKRLLTQWEALDEAYLPLEQAILIRPRPLLIIHGDQDEVVPVEQALALHDRTKSFSRLLIHPEANHAFVWQRDWIKSKILGWLSQLDFN